MKIPPIECEHCGSNSVRLARYNGIGERIKGFFGIQPFRCRDCKHRFTVSIWLFDKFAYAKCPKCLRMDLVFWSKKYYKPSPLTNFLISMGAQRYRCSACRCNFVSFRPRKRLEKDDEVVESQAEALSIQATELAQNEQANQQEQNVAEAGRAPETGNAIEKAESSR